MSKKLDELALRKQLLVARSALYRVQIRSELDAARASMSWVNVGMRAMNSLPVRSALLGIAVSGLGHGRVAQMIALASRALLVAKAATVAFKLMRSPQDNVPVESQNDFSA